jgi:hypothetical protein
MTEVKSKKLDALLEPLLKELSAMDPASQGAILRAVANLLREYVPVESKRPATRGVSASNLTATFPLKVVVNHMDALAARYESQAAENSGAAGNAEPRGARVAEAPGHVDVNPSARVVTRRSPSPRRR